MGGVGGWRGGGGSGHGSGNARKPEQRRLASTPRARRRYWQNSDCTCIDLLFSARHFSIACVMIVAQSNAAASPPVSEPGCMFLGGQHHVEHLLAEAGRLQTAPFGSFRLFGNRTRPKVLYSLGSGWKPSPKPQVDVSVKELYVILCPPILLHRT